MRHEIHLAFDWEASIPIAKDDLANFNHLPS